MVQYRPKSLHITASDISQGQNRRCVFKTVQYRLCICIFLRLIYQKDKTGVVYSKRWNIAFVFAYCCILYITRTKLMLCIQNGAVSPYVFAYCCIWYVTRTKLVLCIQNGAISPCVFAYCCIWYVSRTKLVVCIKNVRYRPMSLHIAASDISQGQKNVLCFQKGAMSPYVFAYCCIWYNYHEGRSDVVYSKKYNIAYVIAYCSIRHITRTKLLFCIQNGAVSS